VKYPLILALGALIGCQEQGFSFVKDYGGVYESILKGRACDANTGKWLDGATVYTHIILDGNLIGTRESLTDAEGNWTLTDLRGGQVYTVYVQYGNELVDMFEVEVGDSEEREINAPACGTELGRVAVISGDYDDWESTLSSVGVTNYELVNGLTGDELGQFLSDGANLGDFGAIFFAGGHIEEDVLFDSDGSDVDGRVNAVKEALKAYVEAGGFVYASDWSYDVLELCWPAKVEWIGDDADPGAAQLGEPTTLRVANSTALEEAIGAEKVDVTYDLDAWPLIESVDESVTVYQTSDEDVPYRIGIDQYTASDLPVLAGFSSGEGRVVFSTWRVAANTDRRGPDVFRYVMGIEE